MNIWESDPIQKIYFFLLKIQHIFMTHLTIFYLPELLEYILHFLVIDKSLYPALFISRLWYRCGTPILWKCIDLKGNGYYCAKNPPQLKKFIKLVCGKKQLVYSLNLTHLEISYYHPLSDKKSLILCAYFQI